MSATDIAFNPPRFDSNEYEPGKMRLLVEELERLHASLTADVDDEGEVGFVLSFAGRTGDVVPQLDDYDTFFLTPTEGDATYLRLDASNDNNVFARLAQAEIVTGAWGFEAGLDVIDGSTLRILDSSNLDSGTFSHDGTDFNSVFTNTTDWNITGLTAIQAGTVDVDFDAITATSYGGILEANLLDKTADEDITGAWDFDSGLDIANNQLLRFELNLGGFDDTGIYRATGDALRYQYNANVAVTQSLGDFNYDWRDATDTTNMRWDPTTGFMLLNGLYFRIYDAGTTDYGEFSHDGTDFNADFTNTTDWNVTGLDRIYMTGAGDRYQTGADNGGSSGTLGNTQHTDAAALNYRTYWAYDSYWDENADQWVANRTTLGRKYMIDMGYHNDAIRFRGFDGTVSVPWADSDWTDMFELSSTVGLMNVPLYVRGSSGVRVYDSTNTDFIEIDHDGTHAVYDHTGTQQVRFFGHTAHFVVSPDDTGPSAGISHATATHLVALSASNASDILGFQMYNPDGTVNPRATFFQDAVAGEWGLGQTWSAGGQYDFVLYSGGVEHMRWDFGAAAVTVSDFWTFGDASATTVANFIGGASGNNIATFQRDPGGTADVEIAIHGSSGFPQITFDRDIGTATYSIGETGNEFIIAQGNNINSNAIAAFDTTTVEIFANLFVRDGDSFRIYDSTNTDYLTGSHNGTDFVFDTSGTGKINFRFGGVNLFELDNGNSRNVSYAPLLIEEQASANADVAGFGQLWVRNDTPNTLMFTDDAGNDHDLTTSGGSQTPWTSDIDGAGFGLDNIDRLEVQDGTGADSITITHNGTDVTFNYVNTTWHRFTNIGSGWLFQDGGELRVYDSVDTDYISLSHDGTNAQISTNAGNIEMSDDLLLSVSGSLYMIEKASANTDAGGFGQLWVRNDTPNTLMFTDDAGNDYSVNKGAEYKHKTATTARTSTATLADDPHLAGWNLDAGAYYAVEMFFRVSVGSTTPGFRFAWQFSQTPQLSHGGWAYYRSNNTQIQEDATPMNTAHDQAISSTTDTHVFVYRGMFKANATTGGTLDFQWSQSVSNATATNLLEGSWAKVTKIG